jgi:hypothetical protein
VNRLFPFGLVFQAIIPSREPASKTPFRESCKHLNINYFYGAKMWSFRGATEPHFGSTSN